jgi:hypothetical protein
MSTKFCVDCLHSDRVNGRYRCRRPIGGADLVTGLLTSLDRSCDYERNSFWGSCKKSGKYWVAKHFKTSNPPGVE